jgi:hypothetical protein
MGYQDKCAKRMRDQKIRTTLMLDTAEETHGDGIGITNGKKHKENSFKMAAENGRGSEAPML